jgi:hypothetical protein
MKEFNFHNLNSLNARSVKGKEAEQHKVAASNHSKKSNIIGRVFPTGSFDSLGQDDVSDMTPWTAAEDQSNENDTDDYSKKKSVLLLSMPFHIYGCKDIDDGILSDGEQQHEITSDLFSTGSTSEMPLGALSRLSLLHEHEEHDD